MTKQKFPREGVQQKWFEGDCCGTHTEQSSNRRADAQPAPLPGWATCSRTRPSGPDHVRGDRGFCRQRPPGAPPAPTSPPGRWFLNGSKGKHLDDWTRSRAYTCRRPLPGALFEGRLKTPAPGSGQTPLLSAAPTLTDPNHSFITTTCLSFIHGQQFMKGF